MYEYLATATDRTGKRSTHRVEAASATAAVAQLKADGYADIDLHTDDAGAATPGLDAFSSEHMTPAEMVEVRAHTTVGQFIFLLFDGLTFLFFDFFKFIFHKLNFPRNF